jgi:nicotinamidase-related amidase
MPELSHIDPRSAALLVMDYQVDTLTRFMTAAQSADAIACVPDLIAWARDAGMMVIHVVVAFRPGHPELSPRNTVFSAVKANGMLVAGSEGAAIHPAAAAREGEPIVVKHRVSPFVGTDLETLSAWPAGNNSARTPLTYKEALRRGKVTKKFRRHEVAFTVL